MQKTKKKKNNLPLISEPYREKMVDVLRIRALVYKERIRKFRAYTYLAGKHPDNYKLEYSKYNCSDTDFKGDYGHWKVYTKEKTKWFNIKFWYWKDNIC